MSQLTIDDVDHRLIALLGENARMALKDLASAVAMSSPSVGERIRKLEESGAIRGYTIEINPQELGYGIEALVRIRPLPGRQRMVEKLIAETLHITECDKVTGEDCYIARIVAHSLDHLDTIVDQLADNAQTHTSIVKSQPVRRRLPPPADGDITRSRR